MGKRSMFLYSPQGHCPLAKTRSNLQNLQTHYLQINLMMFSCVSASHRAGLLWSFATLEHTPLRDWA